MNILKLGVRGKDLSSELMLFLGGGWGKGLLMMPGPRAFQDLLGLVTQRPVPLAPRLALTAPSLSHAAVALTTASRHL